MPHPSEAVQPNAKRRIVFVRQRFSSFGGGELILDRTIAALPSRGVNVALLGRSWTGGGKVDFIECNPGRFPRFLRERKFASAACKRLADEADSLIQSHERMPCCEIYRAGDGVHAAFIAHRARGMNTLAGQLLALHPFHRSVMALEREMFASARLKRVIANSTMVADEIVEHFGFARENISIVPNGIDLTRFHPDARERHRAEVRKKLGTDPQRPVALFLGSGFKRKGLENAIRALASAAPDAELWAVGHDRRPAAYTALAAKAGMPGERFRLIGPVKDPVPYYGAADMLILPSIYDPFPSTVIEAMACGLPAVTSTGCGAREATEKLDAGLVCDAYDVPALGRATRRAFELAADPAARARARMIAEDYDLAVMIDRLLAIYASLGVGQKTGLA